MASRFDIAAGREPKEPEGVSEKGPSSEITIQHNDQSGTAFVPSDPEPVRDPIAAQFDMNRAEFFLRRAGGEEVPLYVQNFNTSMHYDPTGGVMTNIEMSFSLTQEQVRRLNGR